MHSQGQTWSIKRKPARGLQAHDGDGVAGILWNICVVGLVTSYSDLSRSNSYFHQFSNTISVNECGLVFSPFK